MCSLHVNGTNCQEHFSMDFACLECLSEWKFSNDDYSFNLNYNNFIF